MVRNCEPRVSAAGHQHVAVEPGVVRGQEFYAFDHRSQRLPDFAEAALGRDVIPCDAVDRGELEPRGWWANQADRLSCDPPALDANDAQGTRTQWASIGRLEIDGRKGAGPPA